MTKPRNRDMVFNENQPSKMSKRLHSGKKPSSPE